MRERESDLFSRGIRWALPVLGSNVIRACSCSNATRATHVGRIDSFYIFRKHNLTEEMQKGWE